MPPGEDEEESTRGRSFGLLAHVPVRDTSTGDAVPRTTKSLSEKNISSRPLIVKAAAFSDRSLQ